MPTEQQWQARVEALEKQCAVLSIEIDNQRAREEALSAAYLRLRQLIGREAFDTPYGPTSEQVWTITETALAKIVAQIDRLRPVVAVAEAIAEHGMSMARYNDLRVTVYKYHRAMAQLARDGG
jgi:hypothetical protein